jgi:hypothetical protein
MGAAMATFLTQSLVFVAQIYLAIRLVNLSLSAGLFFRFVGFILLVGIVAYGLQSSYFTWPWQYGFLLSMAIGLVSAFGLKLLDLRSWLSWLGL